MLLLSLNYRWLKHTRLLSIDSSQSLAIKLSILDRQIESAQFLTNCTNRGIYRVTLLRRDMKYFHTRIVAKHRNDVTVKRRKGRRRTLRSWHHAVPGDRITTVTKFRVLCRLNIPRYNTRQSGVASRFSHRYTRYFARESFFHDMVKFCERHNSPQRYDVF